MANAAGRYHFSCTSGSGAWVVFKDYGDKTYLLNSLSTKKYVRANHDSWCDFATQTLELGYKHHQIIFVTGFIKTSAWYIAAYQRDDHLAQTMALTGAVPGVVDASLELHIERHNDHLFESRVGPKGRESSKPLSYRDWLQAKKSERPI